jgi:predicted glycosyl hydrolase (DUF1957 family)
MARVSYYLTQNYGPLVTIRLFRSVREPYLPLLSQFEALVANEENKEVEAMSFDALTSPGRMGASRIQ